MWDDKQVSLSKLDTCTPASLFNILFNFCRVVAQEGLDLSTMKVQKMQKRLVTKLRIF